MEQDNSELTQFLTQCHRKAYPKNKTVIYDDTIPKTLYFITKGSVTVLMEDEEGKELSNPALTECVRQLKFGDYQITDNV